MREMKSDQRAIIVLAIVACLIVFGIVLFGGRGTTEPSFSVPEDTGVVESSVSLEVSDDLTGQDVTDAAPSNFDPNTVDSATLVALGLQPYQVHAWLRYRNAGGLFYEPQDIERLYTLSESDIKRLMPKVRIRAASHAKRNTYPHKRDYDVNSIQGNPSTTPKDTKTSRYEHKFETLTKVEVNTADTTLLKRIPGIGSYIARWIVERRDKLGGFYAVEQLLEVKHVEPSMLEWFSVDATQIHRTRLCDMTFAEMSRFPYIGYEKAKSISDYQRIYGPIVDAEQLRATRIFTDEELEKLQNYIF